MVGSSLHRAPAMAEVSAAMVRGQYQAPTPFFWVDLFVTPLDPYSSLQEDAKGWHSGQSSCLKQ